MAVVSIREKRSKIKKRIRAKISGTASKPRLSVFRSNKEIYAQIINDETGNTLVSVSSRDLASDVQSLPKIEQAKKVGAALADAAKKAGVSVVAFDRNGYLYHGRVQSLANGAREAGLEF